MAPREFHDALLPLLEKAGKLALDMQSATEVEEKADKTVVTATDLAVTQLMLDGLKPLYTQPGHMMLDEENAGEPEEAARLLDAEYLWVMDPIDGTATYALGLPMWGVCVGVLRRGQPWLGFIYLPALGELYYADDKEGYVVTHAFTPQAKKRALAAPKPRPQDMNFVALGTTLGKNGHHWDGKIAYPFGIHASCVTQAWTVAGRVTAAIRYSKVWDVVIAWPMFKHAGMQLLRYPDGQPLERITADLVGKNWYLEDIYFVCEPQKFSALKKGLILPTTKGANA